MTKDDFQKLIGERYVLLDGATGTELMKRGMPVGICPELWVSEHPETITDVQQMYSAAGSQIVYTATFGCNKLKLRNFGLEHKCIELNKSLAEISRKAVPECYVFGDISQTGHFIAPMGDLSFEEVFQIYSEQVKGLLDGGVDGFVIETMADIQETRAAVLAVKSLCDLPVMVSMTFESAGRTLTGNTPEACLIAMQALGVDAFGCNCSCGPKEMIQLIQAMAPYTHIPLLAKPNAGLPRLDGEKTVFSMDASEFGAFGSQLVNAGASLLGGCCGTSPEYISRLREGLSTVFYSFGEKTFFHAVSSTRGICRVGQRTPFTVVGERINPTGKKALRESLRAGSLDLVCEYAEQQEKAGAMVLDVNLGVSGIDEKDMMLKAMRLLSSRFALPLCFDTTNPDAAEAVLREYPGRALFNSISLEADRINNLLPRIVKYGPMLVLLPVTDEGVPETAEERILVVQKIFANVQKYGYTKEDICVDALAMTVAANSSAAIEALKFMNWCAYDWKVNVICGLSNVSHGLPRRDIVNKAFLGMAMGNGLNMAIVNPMQEGLMEAVHAGNVLNGIEGALTTFLENSVDMENGSISKATETKLELSWEDKIRNCLFSGDSNGVISNIESGLKSGLGPSHLVDDVLIPGISEVGERFEKKVFFLPQLMNSATALKKAMEHLTPYLEKTGKKAQPAGKIIMATVRYDIHDIGKNIVTMMLRNYNFEVIDLGKDVSAEVILDTAERENVKVIGLSALMTTTMKQMKVVVEMARQRQMTGLKFIVGGAAVDQQFADEIGAFYSKDAMSTVKIAEKLFS